MKYRAFLFSSILALLFTGVAIGDCCGFDECPYEVNVAWDIGAGYRQDNLSWAFKGFSPGESIHEKWNDISIGFIETNGKVCYGENYLLKFNFDYGWSGTDKNHHVKLVDYNSNEITHRPKTETKAEVYDISLGLGYQYRLDCYPLIVTPLIGWSYNHQRFKNPNFYSHRHATSNYSWNSGWLGFDLAYQLDCPWILYLDYGFHIGAFNAHVNEFFRDRNHSKQFYGNEVEIGTVYHLDETWYSTLKFNYKDYWSKNRSVYESFDGRSHRKRTEWNSYAIALDVGSNF